MQNHYRHFILNEFEKRKIKNPSYSMTAFARDLELKQPTLSRLLNGKIGLSEKNALNIAKRLALTHEETQIFLLLVQSTHSRSPSQKKLALENLSKLELKTSFKKMDELSFLTMQDWKCWAIYFLTEIDGFKTTIPWIAERLGVTSTEAELAVQKLFQCGMLVEKEGKWIQKEKFPKFQSEVPSQAIQNHHKQILQRAERSLGHVSLNKRNFMSFHLAIDESNYNEFKELLEESITNAISKIKNKSSKKTKVYTASLQFFPLEQST